MGAVVRDDPSTREERSRQLTNARIRREMERAGCATVEEFAAKGDMVLLSIEGFGRKSLERLHELIALREKPTPRYIPRGAILGPPR